MKIRVEMEIDLQTGTYDVRFQNQSHPGTDIDLARLTKVVTRVLDNVVVKSTQMEEAQAQAPAAKNIGGFKADVN